MPGLSAARLRAGAQRRRGVLAAAVEHGSRVVHGQVASDGAGGKVRQAKGGTKAHVASTTQGILPATTCSETARRTRLDLPQLTLKFA